MAGQFLYYGAYYYIVTTVNANGESAISNCVGVLALLFPSAPIINLISPNINYNGEISISWTIPPGSADIYLYRSINPILSVTGLNFIANLTTNSLY